MAKFQKSDKSTESIEAREVVRKPVEDDAEVTKSTGREGWVYVTIPEQDLLGDKHPGIGINQQHWGPGTHLVSPEIAGEITRMLRVFDQSTLRIMSPRKDILSIRQTGGGGYTEG